MKKILLSAALLGTIAAALIVYVQYVASDRLIEEDPTEDFWHS